MIGDVNWDELKDKPSKFIDEVIGIEPFEYQRRFMNSPSTRKLFVAGRQVGKSRVASWMALHYAVTHPDSLVLVTADALRQSSELFTQIQSEINNAGMSDDLWGIDRSTQTEIEFDHGSRIKVVPTGRNGNKIRGFTADMIIVDEAAFVEDDIFEEVIEPMTFVSGGTIVLCSTPYGSSGYFYNKYQEARDDPESKWTYEQVGSSDNPKITDDQIEQFKTGKTRNQIKQEVLGQFVPTSNQFFPNPLIKQVMNDETARGIKQYAGQNQKKKQDENCLVSLGVDMAGGGADDTAFIKIDEFGNIFDITTKNMGVQASRQHVEKLDRFYDFDKIVVDETGIGEGPVENLRSSLGRRVEGVYLSTRKKQSIYQSFKAQLEGGLISIINEKDARIQMEKLEQSKNKTGNLSLHAESGYHDDIVDAMALAAWSLPDNPAGLGSSGAGGMTEIKTIGQVTGSGRNRTYHIGPEDDDGDDLRSTTVRSAPNQR